MKKSISIVLVLSIIAGLFAMCGVTAFAENDIMDYITYEIVDGEVRITDCDESISGDIVIPNTIDGYPVTVITENSFSGCDGIASVYIPENIREEDYYFYNSFVFFGRNIEKYIVDENNKCFSSDENGVIYNKDKTKLLRYPCGKNETEFVIPETVTYIDTSAFRECLSLVNITIPDGVVYIGPEAFQYCPSLFSIEIPDSVEFLDYNAFHGCLSLKSVVIGDGVKSIHSFFDYCINLETIELGSSVEELYYALQSLPALKNIIVDENNSYYSSVDGYLLSKDGTKLITYPMGKGDSFKIPDCVTTIAPQSLFPVSFKDIDFAGISEFEEGAFTGAMLLESVVFPETVDVLKDWSFVDCYSMKDVYIYNPDMFLGEYSIGYMICKIAVDADKIAELYKGQANSKSYEEEQLYQELINKAIEAKAVDTLFRNEDLTIHGYAGSTAETYANENGFKFVPICRHNYVDTVITPATYTQAGEGGMVCEHCGDVQSTYEIPMLEIEDSEEKIDKDTGVSVVFPEGAFDGEAEIEVKPVEDGEAYKLISHKEGNYKVTMFDINVTVDGQKVQPNGTVLVQIPLPKGYNQNKCAVYYVADDGTMEELKTYHNKDGYVYFETNHFSYYAILEEAETAQENTENDFISYLRSLLNRFINAYLRFLDMIKAVFHMA